MKDLIAKLHLDANCALGAIWLHIESQAVHVAELEAQIAASADTDKLREFVEAVATNYSGLDNQERLYCYGCEADLDDHEPHKPDCIVLRAQAMLSSTALQAPVREVPGVDHLTGKWCYSRDGEEFTGPFDTEQEAHAEAQEYAEEGEHYWIGQIKHPADCIGSDRNIGDGIITCAEETAYDECGGDDRAFEFSHEQCEQLGTMVREFIRREGSVNRWAVVGSTQHAAPAAPVQEPKP